LLDIPWDVRTRDGVIDQASQSFGERLGEKESTRGPVHIFDSFQQSILMGFAEKFAHRFPTRLEIGDESTKAAAEATP